MRQGLGFLLIALAISAVFPSSAEAGEQDAQALVRIGAPPLGLPPVPIPEANAPTAEKIALGRKLFFDRRLSHNNTISCAMCHVPEQGFTNNELATPIGVEGRSIRRNAPTILNVAYQESMFHDGRDTSLETQIINPLLARNEMANPSVGFLMAKIANLPDYAGLFEQAFGGGPTIGRVGDAIAAWERTMLAADSPFDRWRYGAKNDALTEQQQRGFALFTGKAGCANCHLIDEEHALFTDHGFHDTGLGYYADQVAARSEGPVSVEIAPGVFVPLERAAVQSVGDPRRSDLGRHEVTLDPADLWHFKTPSLRNAAVTGPYMHDGSLRTLEEVVRFYDDGGHPHPGLDPMIRPLGLAEDEIAAIVAFLESLTGSGIAELVADARSTPIGN
jgi:cytochrome c peroxidase